MKLTTLTFAIFLGLFSVTFITGCSDNKDNNQEQTQEKLQENSHGHSH